MEGKSIPAEELQDPRSQGRGALGVFKNQKENHWLAFLVEVQTATKRVAGDEEGNMARKFIPWAVKNW
jgi:hypothetical protein